MRWFPPTVAVVLAVLFCASGTPGCDADYVYADRPASVRAAVARIALCFRTAFAALRDWLDNGRPPPPGTTLPRPTTGDLANTCTLTPP